MASQLETRKTLTIGGIADQTAPAALSHFGKSDLDFHLAHREVRLFGVDLTLEWLEGQHFVAVLVS